MQLFDSAFSPFARKVRMVLEHKGLECDVIDGLLKSNHVRLRAVNGRLEVPTLVAAEASGRELIHGRVRSRRSQLSHRFPIASRAGAGALVLIGCAGPLPRADACVDPLTAHVTNSCVVSKHVLWRGAKPDPAGAAELVNLGVRTVVNLELLHDDRDAFRDARPRAREPLSLGYFRVREWEPNVVLLPNLLDRSVAEFLAIARSQPKPIYVHCRSGQNRTGVMVAAYRVLEENEPIEAAVSEMAAYQGIWFKQDAEYIRQLVGERAARLRAMAAERVASLRPEAWLLCTSQGCRPR
jgi:hypothetical protein